MIKPETRFANNLFSKVVSYIEKTNNPYRAGMPDYYIEGNSNILWCEVKWIEKPWIKDLLPSQICKTKAWPRQRQWLERAQKNNKQTCVIVGIGQGRSTLGYILEFPFSFSVEKNLPLQLTNIRTYIDSKCNLVQTVQN